MNPHRQFERFALALVNVYLANRYREMCQANIVEAFRRIGLRAELAGDWNLARRCARMVDVWANATSGAVRPC